MMRKLFAITLLLSLALACDKPVVLPWDTTGKEEGEDTPVNPPVTPTDPSDDDEPAGAKPRYLWIDASANFQYFANDSKRIESDLQKIKKMGFTDVIVDVRPTEGTVLYKSEVAPEAKRLAAWVGSSYKFVSRTAEWDYLQAFIDAGHRAGLRVNAAMNTFVGGYGGYFGLASEGPIFSGDIPTSWATMDNTSEGIVSSYSPSVSGTVFLNPANDEVQTWLLKIIAEIAAYNVDGIILDRCRFDDSGLQSDFSDVSKTKFAQYLGSQPSQWPVFTAGTSSLPSKLSAEQKAWLSFRVKTIHDFVEKAASTVHSVNPSVRFGCYVGAWYSSYYESGVNWASPQYMTHTKYKWADTDYHNWGYADHCDFMMLGCYAGVSSIYGSGEWTMQGFAKLGKSLLCGDCPCAGGPDIGNSTGFENGGQGKKLYSTVDACINAADGYFCFDLCHIRMYDYWSDFEAAMKKYLDTL